MAKNKKTITETRHISSIYAYLLQTTADTVIVRTTRVSGGWYDVESSANSAGFNATRFINQDYVARREFSECYSFTRK